MAYDLLLRGGTVIDSSQGLHSRRDVAIAGDAIAAVSEEIPESQAARVVDVTGKLVTPGLVDAHCHVFYGVGIGCIADRDCLLRGTTTVVEGGAPGTGSFTGFRKYVAESSRTRVFGEVNLSTVGMVDLKWSEFAAFNHVDVDAAVRCVEENRDIAIGIKLRVSASIVGGNPFIYLKAARQAADAAGTKMVVHIGESVASVPEILPYFKPGDMLVHCFTGRRHGILDGKGRVHDAVWEARRAGVLFDSSSGGNHFSFDVARKAIDQGFLPDIISTDITMNTARDPHFHMPLMMTRHLALGMTMDQVVQASTVDPARAIDRVPKLGTLQAGAPADVTVLDLEEGAWLLSDTEGQEMKVTRRLEPVLTVLKGTIVGEPE